MDDDDRRRLQARTVVLALLPLVPLPVLALFFFSLSFAWTYKTTM